MPNLNTDLLKSRNAKMALGIALTVITFLSGRLVTPLAINLGMDQQMVRTSTRAMVGVVLFVAMGAGSWLVPNLQKIRDTWHYSRVMVMINIVLAVLVGTWASILLLFLGEVTTQQLADLLYVTVLCVFVGINEEVMFRGLMFGGLLAGLGNRKNGPLWAAIISSVAFGFIHVAFDISSANAYGIIQALMKTLETSMFAVMLCVPALEGRNLVGAITVHAFFDWVILLGNAFNGRAVNANYVSSDPTTAIAGSVLMGVLALLYLPKTIQSVKRLRSMKLPQYGPFVPEAESAKLANTAWRDEKAYQANKPAEHVDAHIGKLRDHKLYNNKYLTLPATLISFLIADNLVLIFAQVLFSGIAARVVAALCTVALSIIFVLAFQARFRGSFDGMLGWSTTGMLLVLPSLMMGLLNVLGWPGATFNNPLVALVLAMAPGFTEEVICRGIPASNWMRVSGERKDLIPCVVITSGSFALMHALNLLAGAALSSTLFQIFYAFCLGTVFCAVFLRTGSIWPTIILHTIIDFLSFMTSDLNNPGLLSTELTFGLEFWLTLALSLGMLAWAVYLLQPAKQDEVVALWKKKWHKEQPQA